VIGRVIRAMTWRRFPLAFAAEAVLTDRVDPGPRASACLSRREESPDTAGRGSP